MHYEVLVALAAYVTLLQKHLLYKLI